MIPREGVFGHRETAWEKGGVGSGGPPPIRGAYGGGKIQSRTRHT